MLIGDSEFEIQQKLAISCYTKMQKKHWKKKIIIIYFVNSSNTCAFHTHTQTKIAEIIYSTEFEEQFATFRVPSFVETPFILKAKSNASEKQSCKFEQWIHKYISVYCALKSTSRNVLHWKFPIKKWQFKNIETLIFARFFACFYYYANEVMNLNRLLIVITVLRWSLMADMKC